MSIVVEPTYVMKRVIVCADAHAKELRKPDVAKRILPQKFNDIEIIGLSEFHINEDERRKTHQSVVGDISSNLLQGEHFEAPFVCYKTNNTGNNNTGTYRLIDGHHRFFSISKASLKDPEIKVLVWIAEYKNLTPSQVEKLVREKERAIYTMWNKGTKESATDYLNNHYLTVPLGQKMLDSLPVEVYKSKKKLSVRLLMGCHIIAKHTTMYNGKPTQSLFGGGYAGNGEQTVADFRTLKADDVATVRAFILDYQQIFGEVDPQAQWYQSTPLQALYRIWYDNRTTVPHDTFIKVMSQVFAKHPKVWESQTKSGGRSACKSFYTTAIMRLKAHSIRGKLVNFRSDMDITGKMPKNPSSDEDFSDEVEE